MLKIKGRLFDEFHIINTTSKNGNKQQVLTVFNIIDGYIPILYFRKPKNISQENFDEIFEILSAKLLRSSTE